MLLLFTQALQLIFQRGQGSFALRLFQPQALQLLAARQHTALSVTGPANPQKMPANPIAVAADQAFAGLQAAARGQCRVKILDWLDLRQPGRQVDGALDLVEQAARLSHAILARAYQAQVALGKPG
ncbi:hypothetical protein D3C76_917370 [compost metagenome]